MRSSCRARVGTLAGVHQLHMWINLSAPNWKHVAVRTVTLQIKHSMTRCLLPSARDHSQLALSCFLTLHPPVHDAKLPAAGGPLMVNSKSAINYR